jgi:hypothetical protein
MARRVLGRHRAYCTGFLRHRSRTRGSAPAASSARTTPGYPRKTAQCSGVCPLELMASGPAPAASRRWSTSTLAAACRGVVPPSSVAFASAPASSSACTVPTSSRHTAACNGAQNPASQAENSHCSWHQDGGQGRPTRAFCPRGRGAERGVGAGGGGTRAQTVVPETYPRSTDAQMRVSARRAALTAPPVAFSRPSAPDSAAMARALCCTGGPHHRVQSSLSAPQWRGPSAAPRHSIPWSS